MVNHTLCSSLGTDSCWPACSEATMDSHLMQPACICHLMSRMWAYTLLTIFKRMITSDCWGCRIHQMHLCRGIRFPLNKCPGYDAKQSDGEASVTLKLWRMLSTPLLPSLPGPLWPQEVAPDRVLSMSQIELNCVLIQNWIV